MHVTVAGDAGVGKEAFPVPGRGLVGAGLAGGDEHVERHAQRLHRRVQQVGVGVREDRQPPAALAQLGERRGDLGEGWPRWQRFRQRVPAGRGQLEALDGGHGGQAASQDLSVAQLGVLLHAGLEVVVKGQQPGRVSLAPECRKRGAQAALPVDQGPVAVEGHPPIGHRRQDPIFAPIDSPPGHPEIARIVAPNPGPMTLEGTNTYLVGSHPAYVIDPGPADRAHLAAVRRAAEQRGGIAGVLLTHSHADHSAGVPMLEAPLLFGAIGAGDETSGQSGVAGVVRHRAGARRSAVRGTAHSRARR